MGLEPEPLHREVVLFDVEQDPDRSGAEQPHLAPTLGRHGLRGPRQLLAGGLLEVAQRRMRRRSEVVELASRV